MLINLIVTITGNPNAVMQYIKYEKDIVLKYGVILEGWTHPVWANPSDLSTSLPPLQALAHAIQIGACKFRTLTHQELAERQVEYARKVDSGEIQEQMRKTRSDKGLKRKHSNEIETMDHGSRKRNKERYGVKDLGGKRVVVIDTDLTPSSSSDSDEDDAQEHD
jgi:hypothetical protein